jgi:hypothetical protein
MFLWSKTTAACTKQKKKTSIGIVSAYAAQVIALQERVQSYKKHDFLSVEVCTVDSCQGSEKDIFILSTVRHNYGGNIGFLNCDKRTNVALTRAKNCLWILGHEPTLLDSKSIWSDLVKDAEDRKCFFKARNDDSLARTMDKFRLTQNSQVTDNVLRLNIECQCAPDAQLTGDNRATRPDEAQVEEPALAEQVPVQAGGAAGQVHLEFLISSRPVFQGKGPILCMRTSLTASFLQVKNSQMKRL